MDVREESWEIDAAEWPKPPLMDPLGAGGEALLGQGLDDHSLASSVASSPVTVQPPGRARIVKPSEAVLKPASPAPAPPPVVRGVRGGAGRKAAKVPVVRLTRTVAARMKAPVRELNNNVTQGNALLLLI